MEFWQDERKIAFTTNPNGVSFALDTWEENSLGRLPFSLRLPSLARSAQDSIWRQNILVRWKSWPLLTNRSLPV